MKNFALFNYPRIKHRRTQTPSTLAHYRDYKPFLQAEFAGACVFCRLRDTMTPQGPDEFAVEHYLPRKYHPLLERVYSNLFYACTNCNRKKGTWPYRKKNGIVRRVSFTVPNPCDHVMTEYFWYDKRTHKIMTSNEDAVKTAQLLDLNNAGKVVPFRKAIHAAIMQFQSEVKLARRAIRDINAKLSTRLLPARRTNLLKKRFLRW